LCPGFIGSGFHTDTQLMNAQLQTTIRKAKPRSGAKICSPLEADLNSKSAAEWGRLNCINPQNLQTQVI
jgi:hypothetical protein